jgi:adenylate cyclase
MGANEKGTLLALKAHRTELIDPLVAAHNGQIVKTMGDGLLLSFPSKQPPAPLPCRAGWHTAKLV